MFKDRDDAAHQLADRLKGYRDQHPLVLAIPRGAVPIGKIVARQIGGDFDVVLVRKLRAPFEPEVAIGSVAESGWTYIAPYAAAVGADQDYIAAEKQKQLATIHSRRVQYTPIHAPIDPQGRVVIAVDDGLATGGHHDGCAAQPAPAPTRQAGLRHPCRINRCPAENPAHGGRGGVPAGAGRFSGGRPVLPPLPSGA